MAHEVESMFSVRETPWHGLGRVLIEAPTPEEAIVAAGLDWKVALRPLTADGAAGENRIAVPGHFAVVRESDSRVLGVVGDSYTPVQNTRAFGFFQPFLDSGVAKLETAGSLRDGKRVWVLAKVAGDPVEVVKGDAVERFILLAHGHDGSLAMRIGFTPVRVVCANTLAMSMADGASRLLRIKHTKRVEEAMDEVQKVMQAVEGEFLATIEQYKLLAKCGVTDDTLKAYVRKIFAPKPVSKGPEPVEVSDCDRIIERVRPLFEKGRGNDMAGVKGTMWGAYNAVTEYLGYERGKSQDTRVDSLWFGDSAKLNARALEEGVRFATLGGLAPCLRSPRP